MSAQGNGIVRGLTNDIYSKIHGQRVFAKRFYVILVSPGCMPGGLAGFSFPASLN
jgi:hypothetical protein